MLVEQLPGTSGSRLAAAALLEWRHPVAIVVVVFAVVFAVAFAGRSVGLRFLRCLHVLRRRKPQL
jgi:hypothetical protein